MLSRLLLRAEAVASSRIEGLEIGARRLLRAEAAASVEGESADVTAVEVLADIDAMALGVRAVSAGQEITEDVLLDEWRTRSSRPFIRSSTATGARAGC